MSAVVGLMAAALFGCRQTQLVVHDFSSSSEGWQIAGDTGAAQRLGTKPSTLRSRMKALGISRPA